jgi:putative intracellular protease/amidase
MTDEVLLSFIRQQAVGASYVFSVCTGALLCGTDDFCKAAGPLPTGLRWTCYLTTALP